MSLTGSVSAARALQVLPARLQPPAHRRGLIARPRALAKLWSARTPVVSIVAPAGYGKTTLLAQWVREHDASTGFLTLDASMTSPSTFLTYLTCALGDAIPLDPRALRWLEAPSPVQRRRVLATLAVAVADAPRGFVLVLDDAHLLVDDECVDMLTTVIEHLPEHGQVVLASRRPPMLPQATLRAHGLLTELGPDDLRMELDEVRELMQVNQVTVTAGEARAVTEATEGWPVAVYLASRAAAAGDDLRSFGGKDAAMSDYLEAEFLEEQPESVSRFLRRSAVLHELSGPLCDAALGQKGSSVVLEEIAHSNLLLVQLDREREWYRYHHLLQEALRSACRRLEPEAIGLILLRASAWCEAAGNVEQAIGYAQEAEDAPRVRDLVTRHAMALFASGREDVLRGWFDWLASREATDEAVAVLSAWLHLLNGHGAEAVRLIELAEAGSSATLLPEGSPVAAWTCALRGAMARDAPTMKDLGSQALDLLSPASPLRASVEIILGLADLLDGSLDDADRHLADASELAATLGASGAGILALAGRADIALETNRWSDAESMVTGGERLVDRTDLGGYVGACLLHAVRARVWLREGDVVAARTAMADAEQLTPFLTPHLPALAVLARVEMMRAYLELDDLTRAAESLSALESSLRQAPALDPATAPLAALRSRLTSARSRATNASALSPAELRLVPWLATQFSLREIAEHLFVSVHTVKAQVTSVYRKLGVTSRSQAVAQARAQGLLDD